MEGFVLNFAQEGCPQHRETMRAAIEARKMRRYDSEEFGLLRITDRLVKRMAKLLMKSLFPNRNRGWLEQRAIRAECIWPTRT